MTQLETELDGPDFTQGVEISTVPDGTMLLGHVRGEAVLLVRRGVRLYLGILAKCACSERDASGGVDFPFEMSEQQGQLKPLL